MLINTTQTNSSDWSKNITSYITEKYGSILNLPLPDKCADIDKIVKKYFFRITASFDSCANTPKENIVVIDLGSCLNKEIIKLLEMSKIETISKKILFSKFNL